jgi:hypothetical protein
MQKAWVYPSGEEVRAGDRIRYCGEEGVVDFVVSESTGDSDRDWFMDEYGGGVMIMAAGFGSVFISDADDQLELVARAGA